ncbi:hypothetical protein NKH49_31910 [Mesorhizobium sp. M1088]|uniref:hypothetical protein n=1 Tax=Mesorhizobium sp. M1088 TaxID=2957056 RepID=UPI00333AA226
MLRLSVMEDLSNIARVERLAADWAADKVLRLVLDWPVMRPALIACCDVVCSNPRHLQVPFVVLAADTSAPRPDLLTVDPDQWPEVDRHSVLVDPRDLAFQVDLPASVDLGVVDDGCGKSSPGIETAYAVLCYPPSNRGSNRHLVTNAHSRALD